MSASNIHPRLPVIAFLGLLFATFTLAEAQEQDTTYYEIESLNLGLEAVPDVVIRETPRDTLESFLDLAAQGDYKSAAHLLNLNEIDKASQAAQGPELARMLFEVIDRRVVIDWQDVPSRPDAVNENFPKDHPFAGTARPSLSIASLSIRNRPALIRLNRVKPPESEAVWVFSGQTVGLIPALDRAYGPSWFEDLLPPALSTKFYSGVRIWELIGLPLLLALSVGLAFLQRKLFRALSTHAQVQWIRRASDQVATPLAVASTAVIMMFMTSYVLTFSGAVTVVLEPLLWALVIFGFTFAALNTIDATLEVVTDRYVGEISSSRDSDRRHLYTNIYALRRYVLLVAFLTSTVLLLHKLQVFQSLGWSILASAGVATVILGIAGQSVLGNILASLQIAIAKPIRIGDNVVYEDRWAYVE